ncbi:gp26 family baseplate hub assembly chaperone [bacterium]|nr:gp26 family baseplate hub assembly chaperone [bacterium]MDA8752410.1 gp26 family baseplate hub assembly chaperone [bacterium]
MALPKIDLPLFELTLPSTEETIKYRPFTVKEEKILLMAQEAKDPNQMVLAMRQIATNCCPNLDIDSLAMFDLEYIMLQVRAKSIDNKITFSIKDPDTGDPVSLEIDVDDVELKIDEDHTKEIVVSEDMYLMMRYPRLSEVSVFLNVIDKPTESLFDVMISCIESVVNGDEISNLNDFTKEEVMDFIETFPGGTIDALQKFFETMPKLSFQSKYTNSAGEEKEVTLEGTETFFL